MGKQGPCCHCGVTSTPLWRNGPLEKPVLCNACGSRWRTKGTLANYTPLHGRLDPDDYEDCRVSKAKTLSLKKKDENLGKRKIHYDDRIDGESSSGSAISNSESCVQFGCADASDWTGRTQSVLWDSMVPSKKRTCITRPKQSSVEKLTKDLHTILQEQASHFSSSSEEDLLFEDGAPMGSVEFGHGCVLIRRPSSMTRDEESESSSLSFDNKLCRADEGYVTPAYLLSMYNSQSMYNSCSEIEKVKLNGQSMQLELAKRNKYDHEKLLSIWNHNSSLLQVELTEVVNLDVFLGHLTTDEQNDLFNYLPYVDTSKKFNSLESMFTSPFFMESLCWFRQLLAEGIYDSSLPGVKSEEYKILKRFAFCDLTKSKWVEHYSMIKEKTAKERTGECIGLSEAKSSSSCDAIIANKSRDKQNNLFPEVKTSVKIHRRVVIKSRHERKDSLQNQGSCFISTPHNLFAMNSFQFEDESSDQDLLLNIPSTGSFPEAELLYPASSFAS